MGLARQCRLSNEQSYWSIPSLTNDNMMLIILTLIMFIFYFPHSNHCSHHHHPNHSEFLDHRIALYMLPGSPTNKSCRYTDIISIRSSGKAPLEVSMLVSHSGECPVPLDPNPIPNQSKIKIKVQLGPITFNHEGVL